MLAGKIAALVGGFDFHERTIEFDKDLYDKLLHAAFTFIECLKTDTPPEPGPNDSALINLLYTDKVADVLLVEPSDEITMLLTEVETLRGLRKRIKEQQDQLTTKIKKLEK